MLSAVEETCRLLTLVNGAGRVKVSKILSSRPLFGRPRPQPTPAYCCLYAAKLDQGTFFQMRRALGQFSEGSTCSCPRRPPPLSISQRFVLFFCRSRGFVESFQRHSISFLCPPVKRSSRHPATRPDVSVLQKPRVIDLPCLGEDTTPAERWIDVEPPIPEPRLVRKKVAERYLS